MSAKSLPRLPPRMPGLLPSGTARALFLATLATPGRGAAADDGPDTGRPDDEEPFTRAARAALAAHDVPDEILWAAWEVAHWAAAAPRAERRALASLVVGLLAAVDAGATCLPLDVAPPFPSPRPTQTPGGSPVRAALAAEGLSVFLSRLGLDDAAVTAATALAAQLVPSTAAGASQASPVSRAGTPATGPSPAISALFELDPAVAKHPGQRRPFVLTREALYPERLWWLEQRLVALLRPRLTGGAVVATGTTPDAIDQALREVQQSTGPFALAPEQLLAVCAAVTRPLTLVTGGPGTGKTSTVVALLRTLARLGIGPEQIALAAPTGRAAQRMKESVVAALGRLESPAPADRALAAGFAGASTLHTLLGIRPSGQRPLDPALPEFYSDWPLPARVVIVDEASMIDLVLMEQLCAAVPPSSHLILIGDVDQLPSVQVGAVFRDLVAGAPAMACHLTRSHRMDPEAPSGADILRVAAAVNAGAPAAAAALARREHAAELVFAGSELLEPAASAKALDEFLDRWFREVLVAERHLDLALDRRYRVDATNHLDDHPGDHGGDHVANFDPDGRGDLSAVKELLDATLAARILCVTRTAGRTTSTVAINQLLHARVQAAAFSRGVDESTVAAAFIPGEPVIVLRNDHTRGLANGDLGVVLRIAHPRGDWLGVAFARGDTAATATGLAGGNGVLVHPLESIRADLALAFALTVHKAQGSEYQQVALILPEVDVPLLTREVLYTAMTRARHGVVVVGDASLFNLGASRSLQRSSGLVQKLAEVE
ncbi:MAG: AAA family ATPase [Myxococcales bacterium]